MYRPRVARTQSGQSASASNARPASASSTDESRKWRIRAGALALVGMAVAIPVAASAAAQPPDKHETAVAVKKAPVKKISVSTAASQRRISRPELLDHVKAKPATPVTTAAPKPVVTAPPTTRYIPPTTRNVPPPRRYVAPTTRYVPPTRRYVAPTTRYTPRVAAVPQQGSGRCGGNLPPCYVMMRESKGSLTARNPTSTASGKWQFVNGTWGGYGGYGSAAQAPESVQDARAAQVWAGGAGCSNWSACG